MKKLQLSCAGIIKFCLIATIFASIFTMCFFLSCPNQIFAGVTAPYFPQQSGSEVALYAPGLINLENDCNQDCECSRLNYEPVCGSNGVMYFSPCHAGCKKESSIGEAKVYKECGCITGGNKTEPYDAVNTMCESKCTHLWLFASMAFCVMFFTFLATMPALSATLR